MQYEMRRKDRQMNHEKAVQILTNGEYGVLATSGIDSEPYATPLNYIYYENNIIFHSAKAGHKLDNITNNRAVCFNVVGDTKPVYLSDFTTYYESVTVFGEALEVTDDLLKEEYLMMLCKKYLPDYMDNAEHSIRQSLNHTAIYEIRISRMTGKENAPKI